MKYIILISFLLSSTICFAEPYSPNIYENTIIHSKQYVNVHETNNNNRHPEIDKWLKYCGIPVGNSYCQAFTVYMFHLSTQDYKVKDVYPKIARCSLMAKWATNHPLEVKTLSAKAVLIGAQDIQPGYMAIWRHSKPSNIEKFDWNGHAAIVTKVINRKKIETIEANTMPGSGGDQSGRTVGAKGPEGGVYIRTRLIDPSSNFGLVYFLKLNKEIYR